MRITWKKHFSSYVIFAFLLIPSLSYATSYEQRLSCDMGNIFGAIFHKQPLRFATQDMRTGVDLSLSIVDSVSLAEEAIFRDVTPFNGMILCRSIFEGHFSAYLASGLIPHEIFGHGYRIYEMGGKFHEFGFHYKHWIPLYDLYLALTYSDSNELSFASLVSTYEETGELYFMKKTLPKDRTQWNDRQRKEFNSKLLQAYIKIQIGQIGGLEYQAVVENEMMQRAMLNHGKMQWQYLAPYWFNSIYPMSYALVIPDMPGHDVLSHIRHLNLLYHGDQFAGKISQNYTLLSLVNLIDPMLYYSLYCTYRNCSRNVFEDCDMPMLKIGKNIKYMPKFQWIMAPHGGEVYFHNYLLIGNFPAIIDLHYGNTDRKNHFGLGINFPSIVTWTSPPCIEITLSCRVGVWKHPDFVSLIDIPDKYTDSKFLREADAMWGAGVIFGIETHFSDWPLSTAIQIGFKSGGFWLGEPIRSSIICRGSIILRYEF